MAERAPTDERAMSYQTFVVTRLEELVEQAKKEPGRPSPHAPGTCRPGRRWPAGRDRDRFLVSFFV